MKQERALELVAALRSGKYPQTTGRLNKLSGKNPGYCCLGVACLVSGRGEFFTFKEHFNEDHSIFKDGVERDSNNMTQLVAEYFDFFDRVGSRRDRQNLVIGGKSYEHLRDANDLGVSFDTIATYLEENWENL